MTVPTIHSGLVTIHFATGSLFKDFPIPITADTKLSAYRFLEWWLNWTLENWGATRFAVVIHWGHEGEQDVDASQHSAGQEILDDMARIGLELHNNPERWLVHRNTDLWRIYNERYPTKEDQVEFFSPRPTETDNGPEAEDPA